MNINSTVRNILKKAVKAKDYVLSVPPDPTLGDVSSAVAFSVAKRRRKSPVQVAKDIAKKIKPQGIVKEVKTKGPYINFFFDKDALANKIVKEALKLKKPRVKKDRVMVEYFHANSHKGVHLGHARTLFIGEALARILEAIGHKVIRATYGGDIGPHVAKCLWGFMNLGLKPEGDKGEWLGKIYAIVNRQMEKSEGLKEEINNFNKRLYSEDPQLLKALYMTREWSINHFKKIFDLSNTKMDHMIWESEVYKKGLQLSKQFLRKGFFKKSDGAIIADLRRSKLGVVVAVTSDGYPLYLAKDLGLAEYEFKKLKADKVIHVVAVEQQLYFQQLFKIFKKIGWNSYAKNSIHRVYELVDLKEGKMSSRKGDVILFTDLYDDLKHLAMNEIKKKNPLLGGKELEDLARVIAMSAFKYGILSQNLNKKILFDPREWTRFDGDTGAYLQYNYVRAKKIIEGHKMPKTGVEIKEGIEYELVKKINEFEAILEKAAKKLDPSLLTRYAYDLASTFSKFYEKCPVIKKGVNASRLLLVIAFEKRMGQVIRLLGMEPIGMM